MCFRPAGLKLPDPVCPKCDKTLLIVNNAMAKTCPFCKADLTDYQEEYKQQLADLGVNIPGFGGGSSAPGAPKAPGAPGAPKAPGAPGAPKAPGA